MSDGPNGLRAQECRGDFWLMLEKAIQQAHGGITIERLADKTLLEIVDILAQNGIRMVYMESKHIDNIGH